MPPFPLTVVLLGPENSGNIGAVARVMKNFGWEDLVLINPLAEVHSDIAKAFAMHAKDVLDQALVLQFSNDQYHGHLCQFFSQFDTVIGTSAQGVAYKNILRIPVYLPEFDCGPLVNQTKTAIVFGRESTGMTTEELGLMDVLLRIPTSKIYPTLNLSHAVGVILYHFFSHTSPTEREQVILADYQAKLSLSRHFSEIAARVPLAAHRLDRTSQAFDNLVGRAIISQKEYEYIRNLFRKITLAFDRPELIRPKL